MKQNPSLFMFTQDERALLIVMLRGGASPETRELCNKLHFPVDASYFIRAVTALVSDGSDAAAARRVSSVVTVLEKTCQPS